MSNRSKHRQRSHKTYHVSDPNFNRFQMKAQEKKFQKDIQKTGGIFSDLFKNMFRKNQSK